MKVIATAKYDVREGVTVAMFESPLGDVSARRYVDGDIIITVASVDQGPLSNWVLCRTIDARSTSIKDMADAIDACDRVGDRALSIEIARRYAKIEWYFGGKCIGNPTPPPEAYAVLKSAITSLLMTP